MASSTDGERTVSSQTRVSLAVLATAVVVVSSMTLGVTGLAGSNVSAEPSGQAGSPNFSAQQENAFSGTVPLADADTTFNGTSANDTFGAALAHGDVNGDGVEDVLVGAPDNDTVSGNNSGAVYVFYGPVNESDIAAESADVRLRGVDESDHAGESVAAGDVDGDGTDDVVVGAPLNDWGGASAGAAYVVYGGDLPENGSLAVANHTFVGERAEDRAGWSVATVNRSGGDDVLVGAPQNNSSAPNAGVAYVVSDAEPGTMALANATAALTGEGPGDLAGWSVAHAGDFDGDGNQDFVVGAPTTTPPPRRPAQRTSSRRTSPGRCRCPTPT
jgi:hypothetical protein